MIDMVTLAKAVQVGLAILSIRLMALLGLGLTAGLFIAAMCLQTWMSFYISIAFAVVVFLPVLMSARGKPEVSDNA